MDSETTPLPIIVPSDSLEPVLPTSIININFCPKREPGTQSDFGNGPWIILTSKLCLENIWETPSWQRHGSHADMCKWLCFCAWEPAQALRSFLEGMQPQSLWQWQIMDHNSSSLLQDGNPQSTTQNTRSVTLWPISSCWSECSFCCNQVIIRHKTASQVIRQKVCAWPSECHTNSPQQCSDARQGQ